MLRWTQFILMILLLLPVAAIADEPEGGFGYQCVNGFCLGDKVDDCQGIELAERGPSINYYRQGQKAVFVNGISFSGIKYGFRRSELDRIKMDGHGDKTAEQTFLMMLAALGEPSERDEAGHHFSWFFENSVARFVFDNETGQSTASIERPIDKLASITLKSSDFSRPSSSYSPSSGQSSPAFSSSSFSPGGCPAGSYYDSSVRRCRSQQTGRFVSRRRQ